MNKKFCIIISVAVLVLIAFSVLLVKLTKDEDSNSSSVVSGEATLNVAEGNYSLKITTVLEAEADPSTEVDLPECDKVAIVVYEYTNDDIEHGLSIGNSHFKAYDSDGNELSQFPQKGLFEPGEVGVAGTFTASVAFALENSDNYLKIEYYNDVSSDSPDAVFEENW